MIWQDLVKYFLIKKARRQKVVKTKQFEKVKNNTEKRTALVRVRVYFYN